MVQTAKVLLTQSLTTDPAAGQARDLLQEILSQLPERLTEINVTEVEETSDIRLNTLRFYTPCKKQGSLVYFPNGVVQNKNEYAILDSWIPSSKIVTAAEKKNTEYRKSWRKVSVEDLKNNYFNYIQRILDKPKYSLIRYRLTQGSGAKFVQPKLPKNTLGILSVCNSLVGHGLTALDDPIFNEDIKDLSNRLSEIFQIDNSVEHGLRIALFVLNPTGATHVELEKSAVLGRVRFFSDRPIGDYVYTFACLYQYVVNQPDLYNFFEQLFPDWRSFHDTDNSPLE